MVVIDGAADRRSMILSQTISDDGRCRVDDPGSPPLSLTIVSALTAGMVRVVSVVTHGSAVSTQLRI
jgi:hypothetical protein